MDGNIFNLGPHEILLGLGSNSCDKLEKLRQAKKLLSAHPYFTLKKVAPLYESQALLPAGAPPEWNTPYLNSALLLELRADLFTESGAHLILNALKEIEKDLGRKAGPHWGPRPIDIDIIDWAHDPVHSPKLTIPHSEAFNRAFVILPCLKLSSLKKITPEILSWQNSLAQELPFHTQISPLHWEEIMGIVNLTPDSFSDGHQTFSSSEFQQKMLQLLREGAEILDFGAESTRPNSQMITDVEEQARLAPYLSLIKELQQTHPFKISLDSRYPSTYRMILKHLQLDYFNDVEGFQHPELFPLAAQTQCACIFMHSLSVPPHPQKIIDPKTSPIETLLFWGQEKMAEFAKWNIPSSKLIFDPGLGFGKNLPQNFSVVREVTQFHQLKIPFLIGHSRKRFLDPLAQIEASKRDLETAILTSQLSLKGSSILRVHDVAQTKRALQLGQYL